MGGKGSGGKRKGAGKPLKYGEPTVIIFKRVPESKSEEIELKFDKILNGYIKKTV